MTTGTPPLPIVGKIHVVRGHRVMLDSDLAELYGVPTFRMNEAVKRNADRFPDDFMFRLSEEEHRALISQSAISKPGRGGRRFAPFAFTEQGVAMLSSVLNSDRAIQVNIVIMRTFVAVRQVAANHQSISRKLDELEQRYDAQFKVVFDAIRALMNPPGPPRRRIGF